ncbi:hypothetical protein [Phycicoccus sp. Root563]|uniref:hypothetical protein n=1 Tax=Phycicoccus sp. Root563 TaxID=1736562 RepID=UPI0012FA5802|nr:hypothetical protein [Phycicoccus sp. Root563]
MIFPLPRPQYVAVPEALTTALAWRELIAPLPGDPSDAHGGERTPAVLFRKGDRKDSKTLTYLESDPSSNEARLRLLASALDENGVVSEEHQDLLARSLMSSLAGVRAEKGSSQAAVPITPALALMQDMRGLQGAKNPPDVGLILERMFALDCSTSNIGPTVAGLWHSAVKHRLSLDPLASAIDSSVAKGVHNDRVEVRDKVDTVLPEWWHGRLPDTPFAWFRETWLRLTDDAWVEALPARVWVDWASTVLRLALGLGYLWEAAWYATVARHVLRGEAATFDEVRGAVPSSLPWKSTQADMSLRDLAAPVGWRVRRSQQLRSLLSAWIDENGAASEDFASTILSMSRDEDLSLALEEALGSRVRANENLWEAVKYALKTRDTSGPYADHYGLLRSRGRYLWVDPGTEWTAVVASLCCGKPDTTVDLAAVLRALGQLGLHPELADVVALLERAGLARGSADADQGVVVQSAF